MKAPILVTGSHRSGTTWVGRMLCASGEAYYIHEPFNMGNVGPRWVPRGFPYWFYHIPPAGDNTPYVNDLRRVIELRYPLLRNVAQIHSLRHCGRMGRDYSLSLIARVYRKRPLIKDPISLFSVEWYAERFGMRVIVMIRHPLGSASSLKRLNWQFDFTNWAKQDKLMEHLLSPFRDQILDYAQDKHRDIIDQAILMWNAMYSVVQRYQQAHPDRMFVKHEQLTLNASEEFRKLCQYCALTWNRAAKAVIAAYSDEKNVKEVSPNDSGIIRRDSKATVETWKQRLTKKEVERVRIGTKKIASLFYGDEKWG